MGANFHFTDPMGYRIFRNQWMQILILSQYQLVQLHLLHRPNKAPGQWKIQLISVFFRFRVQDLDKLREAQSKINELEKFLKEEMDEKEDTQGER